MKDWLVSRYVDRGFLEGPVLETHTPFDTFLGSAASHLAKQNNEEKEALIFFPLKKVCHAAGDEGLRRTCLARLSRHHPSPTTSLNSFSDAVTSHSMLYTPLACALNTFMHRKRPRNVDLIFDQVQHRLAMFLAKIYGTHPTNWLNLYLQTMPVGFQVEDHSRKGKIHVE